MRFTQFSLTAAALCLALAATGCGTTVSGADAARAGTTTSGLEGPTTSSVLDPATSDGGQGSDPLTSPTTSTPDSVTGTAAAPLTTGGSTGGQAAPVAGGSKAALPTGPVEIGFLVTKCGNCGLLGDSYGKTTHSQREILQALINDKNKHGGLLGRKIVPVFAEEDTASSDFATMLQAICATFTQDHHVKAVVGAGFGYADSLATCLAKASIPIIDAMRTTGVPDSNDLRKHPGYILSGEPELDVYSLVAFTSAIADSWLTPKSVLGVFNYDCPAAVRVYKNVIKPYLASQRITPAVEYTSSCIAGAGDIGKAAQDVQQAVLKMRANNVDTVAITDIPLVVFAEFADSQNYHPKYLATEGGGPTYASLLSSAQASNIHAPGWIPAYDLDATRQPPVSAVQKDCLASLGRGGLTGMSSSEYVTYFGLCGGWDLYLAGVAKAGDLTSASLLNAVNALSGSFVSPFTLEGKTLLGPSRHGAPVRYRTTLYNKACSCFLYSGPSRDLPTP